MFAPGELMVYGSTGVCRVVAVCPAAGAGASRMMYHLKPLYQVGSIYTPVDNDKVVMRPVISRKEAEAVIAAIPTLRPMVCRAATTQALTRLYQAAFAEHSCLRLLELTLAIEDKRRSAEAHKRRLGMVDQRFMKQAERLLYGELSAALDIPYEEVQPYITRCLSAAEGA